MSEKLNIIVQLCTDERTQKCLADFVPKNFNCTLEPDQKGHHVELAFKPTKDNLVYLRKLYNCPGLRGKVFFIPKDIRWNKNICALFGYLTVGKEQTGGFVHITLAGNIPPINSAVLESQWDNSEKALGEFELQYKEVPLD